MGLQTTTPQMVEYLFDCCGYVQHPGVVSAEEAATLQDDLLSHWVPSRSPGIARVRSLTRVSSRVSALANRLPHELQLIRYINQPYRLIESYGLRRAAGSSQGLHNGFSEPYSLPSGGVATRMMWRHHTYHDGKLYCMMVKILLYLTNIVSRADGPFCLVEGSHKANYPLPLSEHELGVAIASETLPNLRTLHPASGDALIINEALMHGTLPKTSDDPRIVLAFSYGPLFVSDYKEQSSFDASAIVEPGFYA